MTRTSAEERLAFPALSTERADIVFSPGCNETLSNRNSPFASTNTSWVSEPLMERTTVVPSSEKPDIRKVALLVAGADGRRIGTGGGTASSLLTGCELERRSPRKTASFTKEGIPQNKRTAIRRSVKNEKMNVCRA